MLLSKLTLSKTIETKVYSRYLIARHSTSSCESSCTHKGKKEDKTRRPKQQGTFAIDIPEKELAHNTFFSLHRPLLGLSDKRPFFSAYTLEEERKAKMERHLSQHMSRLEHFVEPGKDDFRQPNTTEIQIQEIMYSPLPVFRMPESADVLDFLSAIENKMEAENEKDKKKQ